MILNLYLDCSPISKQLSLMVRKDHKYFCKKFGQIEGITYHVMPSTSPTNTMSFENKLKLWSTCFKNYKYLS
jgi:G:T/U-mismatch repair DNA glycosylase